MVGPPSLDEDWMGDGWVARLRNRLRNRLRQLRRVRSYGASGATARQSSLDEDWMIGWLEGWLDRPRQLRPVTGVSFFDEILDFNGGGGLAVRQPEVE